MFDCVHLLKEEKSWKHFQNCESLVAMLHDGNFCEDFVQFRHFQIIKKAFCLGSCTLILCKIAPAKLFLQPSLQNILAKNFKTACHIEQTEKTSVPWHHPCFCTLTNHRQWLIKARVIVTTLYEITYWWSNKSDDRIFVNTTELDSTQSHYQDL